MVEMIWLCGTHISGKYK